MKISARDRAVLRGLAEKQAAIASLPGHKEKAGLWRDLNGLRSKRPMVAISQVCWNEMNINDELTMQCEDEFCRGIELSFLAAIYVHKHFPADSVLDNSYIINPVIHDSEFGIKIEEAVIDQAAGDIKSHGYIPQIKDEADIAKIKDPVIKYDRDETMKRYNIAHDIFGDILDVKTGGINSAWFAPWDMLVQWWGAQEVLLDLVLRPELVHLAMNRLVDAYIARLEQWENLGLLSFGSGNYNIGSGGLAFTDELPCQDFNPAHVRPCDQWGCAAAQIFSEVSPEMHEEFALQYEKRWLKKFGLTMYGCCEPLHNKISILKTVPNLRKISCSPWCKLDKAVAQIGTDYVLSVKPSPAIFAEDRWNPEAARRTIRTILEQTRGCHVEIVAKDLSTMRGQPQRLWEWAAIAMEEVEKY